MVKLDQVLTVAIGRDGSDGKLNSIDWAEFQQGIKEALEYHATVVAWCDGAGVGSDGDRLNRPEDSAVFIAINPKYVNATRKRIAKLLKVYKQSSACFALDQAHEPVFATRTGARI